ncbi:ABC transporter permease [Tissierella pigra]|uniref:ABC transporter permease subunit n=1 Tax=Tissierella pigra TaxID=2607614 RepID=UPI001C124F7D|nr:ABC transporter permease subunit [Tissierella pigra]MBU5425179.1 ABC transporter permease [Tissierella pigra]
MNKIIRNEIYKFFKSRKNILIIILLFAYLLGINYYNSKQYDIYMRDTAKFYEGKYKRAGSILASNQLMLEKFEDLSLQKREELEREIKFYSGERLKLILISSVYEEDNPKTYERIVSTQNSRYRDIIKNIEENNIKEEFLNENNFTMDDLHKGIYINQYILDNEIQPIINPYTMTGANSLVRFLDGNNLIIIMIIIVLLSMDIYLSEVEEGSYKLSYTQPYKRNQIFFGKVVSIIIISTILVVVGAIFNFAMVSIIHGVGNMNYPFVTTEAINKLAFNNQGQYMILSLVNYVIRGFILLFPILLFTIVLTLGISIITDSSGKTLGFSTMIIGLAFILKNFVSRHSIINLIYPYSYLYIKDVIEVNNNSNYLLGIMLNSIMAIVLFVISYKKFIHKDFLGSRE